MPETPRCRSSGLFDGAILPPVATNHARGRARPLTDIVPELARRFLTSPEPPSRLPTIRELSHDHRSSLASIHVAMGRLEEAGALSVETRGRLGAFVRLRG